MLASACPAQHHLTCVLLRCPGMNLAIYEQATLWEGGEAEGKQAQPACGLRASLILLD